MKTLRLICTYDCSRNCAGCCNKQSDYIRGNVKDISETKLIKTQDQYDQIILTGGEPFMFYDKLIGLAMKIKVTGFTNVIVYTADPYHSYDDFKHLCTNVDGVTVTLHDQVDLAQFETLVIQMSLDVEYHGMYEDMTLRLNAFGNVDIDPSLMAFLKHFWEIRDGYKWIPDCPLPRGEVLYKLKPQWKK